MIEADAFNCKAVGMPLNFSRNAFSAAEVTVKMLYDTAKDGVIKIRWVQPS
jgi:predicted small metal-binding protein